MPAVDAPSLYELDVMLTDQDGQRRTLESFRGKPLVLTMFYGTCPYACPLIISDIKRALAKAAPDARSEYNVALVSFDPERDTPKLLKGLAGVHQVDLPAWRLTRADDGKERELSAVLGIKYKKLKTGAIQHTSVIAVLDRRGKLRHRKEGCPRAATKVVRAERRGAPGHAGRLISAGAAAADARWASRTVPAARQGR
jgi:protein SCO1/2